MSRLAEFQAAFADFLAAPPGTAPPAALRSAVIDDGIAAPDRLAVYKNNVYSRVIEGLEAAYPAVHSLVGADFFRFAAQQYAANHPVRERTLLTLGDDFPEFLAGFEPAQSVPYLPDVARLERIWLHCYHAEDGEPLTIEALDPLLHNDAARLTLSLHPSARMMTSPHAVAKIWTVALSPQPAGEKVEIPPGGENLLVIRPGAEVEVRTLPEGTYWMVAMLETGLPVADAMRAGARISPDRDLMADLRSLVRGQSFHEFNTL